MARTNIPTAPKESVIVASYPDLLPLNYGRSGVFGDVLDLGTRLCYSALLHCLLELQSPVYT